MTYPSPYQPPAGYSNLDYYQPDLLVPARRASNMMFVLGGLALLSSFCCIGVGAMVPQLMQRPEFAQRMQNVQGATPELLHAVFIAMGFASAVAGIVFLVLAAFVRRGGKGSIVTALVLTVLSILLMLLYTAGAVAQGGSDILAGLCMATVPIVLLAILVAMLIAALKASEQVAAHRYSVQYWHHAQQQAYAQQGYGQGYGFTAPPIPPPPEQQQSTAPPPPPDPGDSNGPPAQG